MAFLVPGNTNNKAEICTQWEDHTFEHVAYDWFQTTCVNAGVGDFINFTNIPANADEYAAIWIYIDREWLRTGDGPDDHTPFDEGKFDALFNNDVVNALKAYVQNGGNLFLGKQAARLAYRMGRIGYAPNYQCGGYNQDDRFWGIKAKLGSNLPVENQRDRSSHAIYAGLATATMDGVEGCFPLLNAVGDAHSTDNNIHWVEYWTPDGNGGWHKNPDNNGDPALIAGWEAYWNAKALGTWTGIGDYCIIQAVEFMPKDAFTGTILTINIGAYQWNSESTGDAADNMRKLTKNALRYLNTPSRADLKIDNAFHTCGRVDCDNKLDHYNDFMLLHPKVEGLDSVSYVLDFTDIAEAERAEVEKWHDGVQTRLAFTKAGKVNLTINLHENRDDAFWPADSYTFTQQIDFSFNKNAQDIVNSDLSSNGLDPVNVGQFMVLHANMQGLDSLAYTISFDDIEPANRAEVSKVKDEQFTRLVFTKAGSVKLDILLKYSYEHNTEYGKGVKTASKLVTFAPVFAWTHEPDHAFVGEGKAPAQAVCSNVPDVAVKYLSDDATVASIDETSGQITYNKEGVCHITAYVEVGGIRFTSDPYEINVATNLTTYTRSTTSGKYGTICVERPSVATEGATFFLPVAIVEEGDVVQSIMLEEVTEPLVAGQGYFFLANAAQLQVTMNLQDAALTQDDLKDVHPTNGMLGTFDQRPSPVDANELFLSNNQLWYSTSEGNYIGEHRAWLKLNELREWIRDNQPALVPGRRRVSMAVEQTDTATDVLRPATYPEAAKVVLNGTVYILREGTFFTVDGRQAK